MYVCELIRKQLYLDDDLNESLRLLAARTGRPEAEHVRAALRSYLETEAAEPTSDSNPLLDLVGLVNDPQGPDDVAQRHDDYLYGHNTDHVRDSA